MRLTAWTYGTGRNGRFLPTVVLFLAAGLGTFAADRARAQTRAGTVIENQASVEVAGARRIASNGDRLIVAERLGVTAEADPTTCPTDGRTATRLTITNSGNGEEAFLLALPDSATAAVDRNGDGCVGADEPVLGGRTPPLVSGALVELIIFLPEGSTVEVRAATGSGEPGTAFPGRGDGGGEAVVGEGGGRAVVTVSPRVPAPTLLKSQATPAVMGRMPAAGDEVVYTLEARFAGPAEAVGVEDALPAGVRFVPGSLRLDGQPLSDAEDADAGGFDGTRVRVALGNVVSAQTRVIQFRTIIR